MTLSRVAYNLFWLSRYVERAENYARFVEASLQFELDLPDKVGLRGWEPMVRTTGDLPLFDKHYDELNTANALRFLTFDKRNPNSIYSSIRSAREIARTIRENLSTDAWEHLNGFYLELKQAFRDSPTHLQNAEAFFAAVKENSQLFQGILDATVTRDTAWQFSRIGRFLERADKITRILDLKYYVVLPSVDDVGTPIDQLLWATILKSASAFQMFRRHTTDFGDRVIIDFLILEPDFPRSLFFCINEVKEGLRPYKKGDSYAMAESLYVSLTRHDPQAILEKGLHEYLDDAQKKLNKLGDVIYSEFFSV